MNQESRIKNHIRNPSSLLYDSGKSAGFTRSVRMRVAQRAVLRSLCKLSPARLYRRTDFSLPPRKTTRIATAGFTLVEMIVALALFTTVIFIAVGALLNVTAASAKAQSVRTVMDNLNFTAESIARSMRVGTTYHCGSAGTLTEPRDCPTSGSDFIAFQNSDGETVAYRLTGNRVERSTDGGATFLGLTAPEITVEQLQFYVRGAEEGDGRQPGVLMLLKGTAGAGREQTTFNLQTTITQRFIDS